MEAMHIQKYLHISPRKLRLVADMVRKLEPVKALDMLAFTQKGAADDLAKAIKTALGNAKQLGLDPSQLIFKNLEINESMKMRRFRAGTRGRAKPYRKKMSHIKIVLSDEIRLDQKTSRPVSQKSDTQVNRNTETQVSSSDLSEKKKARKEIK